METKSDSLVLVGGRYEILGKLLEGRFSNLYSALDHSDGSPAVLRKLHSKASGDDQAARQQILREGRLLSRLHHPNLPSVREVVEDGADIYLVLDDFGGQTLDQFVAAQPGPPDIRLVFRWLAQLLDVLDYLHTQTPPIIHRDLRPDGILTTDHGVLKLGEFGMARMRENLDDAAVTVFQAYGDPHYVPPQQLMREHSRPAHDVYAAGAVAYFLATGKRPPSSIERSKGREELAPVSSLRTDAPAGLDALLGRMLALDPQQRPANVSELRTELQALIDTHGSLDGTERPSMWQLITSAARSAPRPEPVIPFIDLGSLEIDRDIASILSENVSRAIEGICIGRRSPTELTVAVADPTQIHVFDFVSYATAGKYKPVLVRADAQLIELAREYIFKASEAARGVGWLPWLERKKFSSDALDVQMSQSVDTFGAVDEASPLVAAVDRFIKEAISVRASDIHLESYERELTVRYRIDGVLHLVETYDGAQASAIIKRVKILANMDIAQDRVTQGGRISVKVADQAYDMRVSSVPVTWGENMVLRLLKKSAFSMTLSDLGLSAGNEEKFRRILAQPWGMVMVSGPTGSGKTTSLYACLAEVNRPDRKLITVEDPIEYRMEGVTQVQVNMAPREVEKQVTFAKALREFLRQDPDVILVGEVRDPETAQIAVQAALTGHLLLSTIHTNDAIGIVNRMRDMGVEPYLIGSTIIGGIAQRLVRTVCLECAEPVAVPETFRSHFEGEGFTAPNLRRGRGCLACHRTGYRGRAALYEILEVTAEERDLIGASAPESEVRRAAERHGFKSLYQDGLRKAAEGLVSLEEVRRVCTLM